jgi:hypothetical protein
MSLRPRLIKQSIPFVFTFLVILIFIYLITSFESSQYFKCPSCSIFCLTSPWSTRNNTEDEQTSLDDTSIYCLGMASRLDNEQYLPQSPILRAPLLNSSRLHRLPYRYSQWKSSPRLFRRVTPCEHILIMRLLMIIERICRKNEITFMMSDGTLLGSWRHHDIIPWDDDLDLMIPLEQKTRFTNAINQMNKTLIDKYIIDHNKGKRQYYKISFKHTPSAGGYSWNFPFVDIFFYVRNETHLWQMDDPGTITKVEYVFPLVMRPFGELWLPAPLKPDQIFKFDPFDQCRGHFWDHRNETGQGTITLKCNELKHIYPFVQRDNQTQSTEVLRINDTIIHTIIYN